MKKLILILFIIAVCVGAYGQYIKTSATGGKILASETATGQIKAIPPTLYGVTWDDATSTPRMVRTGEFSDYNSDGLGDARSTMADSLFIIQDLMKGCLLNDDGTVNYYLDEDNWAYKEDGVTPSVLDGTDGQVMVEIPTFYYGFSQSGTKKQPNNFITKIFWMYRTAKTIHRSI